MPDNDKTTESVKGLIAVELSAGKIMKLAIEYPGGGSDMFILDQSADVYTTFHSTSYQGLKFDHEQLKKIMEQVILDNPDGFEIEAAGTDYNNLQTNRPITDSEFTDILNINSMKLNMNSVEYAFGEKRARTDLPVLQDVLVTMENGKISSISVYEPNKFGDKVDYSTSYNLNEKGNYNIEVTSYDKGVSQKLEVEYDVAIGGMENQLFEYHGVSPHSQHKIYLAGTYIDGSVIDKEITCQEMNQLIDLNTLVAKMRESGVEIAGEGGQLSANNNSKPKEAPKKAGIKTL